MTQQTRVLSPKKVVRRSVAIALAIICLVVVAGSVAAFAYYMHTISDKDNTISSLNSQIANLQNQMNSFVNGTETSLGIIQSNPSASVNKTVVVQGFLARLPADAYFLWVTPPPWKYVLYPRSPPDQWGFPVVWNGTPPNSYVQIQGVVRQVIGNENGTDITLFYIEAETVEPI